MNKQELLKQADYNFQRGNRDLAKKYLSDLLTTYPNEEAAWILLAKVVEEKERKIECYKRALKLNPRNNEIRIALARLETTDPTLPHNRRLTLPPQQSPKPFRSTLRVLLVIALIVIASGTTTLVVARNNPESQVAKLLVIATPTVYGSGAIGDDIAPKTRAEVGAKYPQYSSLVDALIMFAVENSNSGMEGAPERPGAEIIASDVTAMEAKSMVADAIPQPGSLSSATITEQQATSWLAMEMKDNPDLPLRDVQVYLRGGKIQIWGMVNGSTDATSALIVGTIRIDENAQPYFELESMQIGQQTIPDLLLSQTENWLNQMLAETVSTQIPGLQLMNINVTNGLITVSGMR